MVFFFCGQDNLLGGEFWAMGRFNLLGGQSNSQGGQMPTQLTCYLPPWSEHLGVLTKEDKRGIHPSYHFAIAHKG